VIDSDKASGHVSAAMLIAGGCTVSGQVLLLRELMAAFQGNELSLGGILAAWLLWGAAGSWMAGMLADRVQRPASLLAAAMAAGAVLLPATVFASGLVRMLCGASPTEMIGFGTFVWTSALVLGPLCLVQGGYFALGSKALWGSYGEASSGRAYLLESAGSAGGGLLLSLLLINLLPPVALALLLAAVMLLCAAALVPAGQQQTAAWMLSAGGWCGDRCARRNRPNRCGRLATRATEASQRSKSRARPASTPTASSPPRREPAATLRN